MEINIGKLVLLVPAILLALVFASLISGWDTTNTAFYSSNLTTGIVNETQNVTNRIYLGSINATSYEFNNIAYYLNVTVANSDTDDHVISIYLNDELLTTFNAVNSTTTIGQYNSTSLFNVFNAPAYMNITAESDGPDSTLNVTSMVTTVTAENILMPAAKLILAMLVLVSVIMVTVTYAGL